MQNVSHTLQFLSIIPICAASRFRKYIVLQTTSEQDWPEAAAAATIDNTQTSFLCGEDRTIDQRGGRIAGGVGGRTKSVLEEMDRTRDGSVPQVTAQPHSNRRTRPTRKDMRKYCLSIVRSDRALFSGSTTRKDAIYCIRVQIQVSLG